MLIAIFNCILGKTNIVAVKRIKNWLLFPRLVNVSTVLREIRPVLRELHPLKIENELVRIGNSGDGGYLVPNDFHGIKVCLSIGSDQEWSFEKTLQDFYGIKSLILDAADKKPVGLTHMQTYIEGWLAPRASHGRFTLEDLVLKLDQDTNLILKMDIEGAEYANLLSTSIMVLKSFKIIILEFHDFDQIWHEEFRRNFFIPTMRKILKEFDPVHFHPNNCAPFVKVGNLEFPKVFEMTFLRKGERNSILTRTLGIIPHSLDRPNVQGLPDQSVDWIQI